MGNFEVTKDTQKWVYRAEGLAEPEYRTYMDWYWRSSSVSITKPGIDCPKCKQFVDDIEIAAGLGYNDELHKAKINHICGATLVFLNKGTEL